MVFLKRAHYLLNTDAVYLNWVASIVMWEVQRAANSCVDRLLHPTGVDAEPVPDLEFDQVLGL